MNRFQEVPLSAYQNPTDEQLIDELLGVRMRLAYMCKRCRAFHVKGLDRMYPHHVRHSSAEPERHLTTDIADYRRDHPTEGAQADG